MDLHQKLPTIHEDVIFREVPKKLGRSRRNIVPAGTVAKQRRADRVRNYLSYSLATIVENIYLDAEMEKRGIFSPDKIVTSVSAENLDVKEQSRTTATESTPQDTKGKKNSQLAQQETILCEESTPKRSNGTCADPKEKGDSTENKEGAKTTVVKERRRNLQSMAAVQHGYFTEEEYKELWEGYQDAMKRYSEVKAGKEKCQRKRTLAEQMLKNDVGLESLGKGDQKKSPRNEKLPHQKEKTYAKVKALDQYQQKEKKLEKSLKDEMKTQKHSKKKDKIEYHGDAEKTVSQRKAKTVEEMEVMALDILSAVRDKKDKVEQREKMTMEVSNSEEKDVHGKEKFCEEYTQKSVKHNGKEKTPRKKLQLLEDILNELETTNLDPSDNVKNPKAGRKERNNHGVISEQIIDMRMNSSGEGIQKIPNQHGHLTIPKTREQSQEQMYTAPVMNTERVRPNVRPNVLARDKKSPNQLAHGPGNFPARTIDSPYVADIRQRGSKVLCAQQPTSHPRKPAPAFPSKQSKSHCNLPEIYGSKKQSKSDVSIFPGSDSVPACSGKRARAHNKPVSTPVSRTLVPSIPDESTIDQVASKTAGKIPSRPVRIPQSPEEIKKCSQSANLQTKSNVVPVVRAKQVLVISQSIKDKTVSINCSIQNRVDNGRPSQRNRNCDRNANSQQNFSAYRTVMSKGSQASRSVSGGRQHGS